MTCDPTKVRVIASEAYETFKMRKKTVTIELTNDFKNAREHSYGRTIDETHQHYPVQGSPLKEIEDAQKILELFKNIQSKHVR